MDSRSSRVLIACSLVALLALAVSALVLVHVPPDRTAGGVSARASVGFDQVVVVAMENHNLYDVYQNAAAPYENGLNQGVATHWQSVTNPSQPNYIAVIGGSTFGVTGDGNHPNLNKPTLVDILSNTGKTWKAFAEDASGTGCSINPPRGEDHYPFLSYTTITGNASRCANLLPGSSSEVISALDAGTNFIWLTPNDCNNMHSCSVSTGDSWLQGWVPNLLSAMQGKRAFLLLWWDEAYTSPPYIPLFLAGPAVKSNYVSSNEYVHYSILKLIEDVWGGGDLGQGDVTAASPLEFFNAGGPDFTVSASPTSVSFTAGQSATSTVTVTAVGGFGGQVNLTAASVPSGVTTSCSPASVTPNGTSACAMTGTNVGSYTVTITGTSGALVHSAAVAVTIVAAGPTARFVHSPSMPYVNTTVTFDASSSSDSDPNATLQARWDWESDGTWDTSLSSSLIGQYAFAAAGSYTVTLQIQDSLGFSDTATQGIAVLDSGGGGGGGGGIGAPPGYGLKDPTKLQAHGPIYIGSNAEFTAANGVRGGTGAAADPYVISDWSIDGNLFPTAQAMLWIEGTSSYAVIENVRISNLSSTNQWEAFQLGHWPATIGTQHVTIRHNAVVNAQHAYGIAVREGSTDISVEANYVQLDANYDWVYGIATDRGVHNVVITGNYVNAHTSGTFRTAGIHISDTHVNDARRATGVSAVRNTVVNATAGAIVSQSSVGTVIGWNLAFMDYPGTKVVGTDYPRGITTEWFSNGTLVIGNELHAFHWGVQVGSDQAVVASNMIYDVDYGIYVLDSGAWPGISSTAETIYNTTHWGVAQNAIRLPSNFQGTVVDLGSGITNADLTPILFLSTQPATRVAYVWSGSSLNVSATVGGIEVFDTASTVGSQDLRASWTGPVASLGVTGFSAAGVAFQLQSPGTVVFDAAGFPPSTTYNVTRTTAGVTDLVLSARSTMAGDLTFTIPSGPTASYLVSPGAAANLPPPGAIGPLWSLPLFFPAIALVLLLFAAALFRRHFNRSEAEDRDRSDPTEYYDGP
ncbi:MAG TPA: alkaline phosphatase family protein [Thermoplasmata archaeon]|nr:alkaline phosphatase family protein [Thermoplasmata archaeon]